MSKVFAPERAAEIVAIADSITDRAQSHWIDGAAEVMTQTEMDLFQREFTRSQGTGKRMATLLQDMLLGGGK